MQDNRYLSYSRLGTVEFVAISVAQGVPGPLTRILFLLGGLVVDCMPPSRGSGGAGDLPEFLGAGDVGPGLGDVIARAGEPIPMARGKELSNALNPPNGEALTLGTGTIEGETDPWRASTSGERMPRAGAGEP